MRSRSILSLVICLSAVHAEVSFNEDIRPLLSNRCYACHGPDEEDRKGELRLDTREGAMRERKGFTAIVPGNIKDSELIYRIVTDDEDEMMPPPGRGQRFSKEEIALMKQWIKEGAKYEVHWSYVKPSKPEVPKVDPKSATIRQCGFVEKTPGLDWMVVGERPKGASWSRSHRYIHRLFQRS